MSHHIYHTKGFVLGSAVSGESNRLFRILTKELGFVRASAQGIRFLKSKLRYSLHDFSYCDLSLVRGKEMWRVTGAVKTENIFEVLRNEPQTFAVFSRVFALLERLLSGEEKNEQLFAYLEEAVLFSLSGKLSKEMVRNFEYVLVLRILSCLGYLGSSADFEIFTESPYWSGEMLLKVNSVFPKVLGEINRSLRESQL